MGMNIENLGRMVKHTSEIYCASVCTAPAIVIVGALWSFFFLFFFGVFSLKRLLFGGPVAFDYHEEEKNKSNNINLN